MGGEMHEERFSVVTDAGREVATAASLAAAEYAAATLLVEEPSLGQLRVLDTMRHGRLALAWLFREGDAVRHTTGDHARYARGEG